MSRFSAVRLARNLGPEKLVVTAVLVWLTLLALGTFVVSSPFIDQNPTGAPVWSNTMYLHGLLIGMVGLLGLVAMDVFGAGHKNRLMYNMVLYGTLGAALFSGVGGIFDRAVTDTVFLWMQIISFFFLDEILLTLTLALFFRAVETHFVGTWAGAFAALGAFGAAVMGHIAGWILEFGNWPAGVVGGYAALAGETWQQWDVNLISAHAHLMVLGVIALVVATTCAYFTHQGDANRLMRFGLWWMALGMVATALIYLAAGFSQAEPPTLFAHTVSGIPGDDFVTGLGVMLGGLVALIGLGAERLPDALARWGAVALSAFTLVTVPVVGYYIELNETVYGHGVGGAAGSGSDAVYAWFHQDFALFLVPGLMLLSLILQRFAPAGAVRRDALLAYLTGSLLLFAGCMLYVFVAPALYGYTFYVSTLGLALVFAGVVLSVWSLVSPALRADSAAHDGGAPATPSAAP